MWSTLVKVSICTWKAYLLLLWRVPAVSAGSSWLTVFRFLSWFFCLLVLSVTEECWRLQVCLWICPFLLLVLADFASKLCFLSGYNWSTSVEWTWPWSSLAFLRFRCAKMVFPSDRTDHIATCLMKGLRLKDLDPYSRWGPDPLIGHSGLHYLFLQPFPATLLHGPQCISVSPFLGSWRLSAWCPPHSLRN